MGNNIEENIEILEKFKNNKIQRDKLERDVRCGGWKIGDIYKCLELNNAIDNILSDYKKVLKENEELKQEKINNDRMIVLAQNETLNYMRGYEDGKNLRRSAVACQIENQQYFLFDKQIEKYKEYIEKLQRENEEKTTILLAGAEKVKQLEKENEELKKFITEGITVAPHSTYKNYRLDFLRENFVSKKKIKDKIEELNRKIDKSIDNSKGGLDEEFIEKAGELLIQKRILQELLEKE